MQITANYGLKKPDQNDAYNIENENYNMDIIDREMQALKDGEGNIYDTTNIGNKYYATIPDLVLKDGYPFTLRFNAASTGEITINLNNSTDKYVVDYFGNKVNNIKQNLIANFRYNAKTGNFQLLGKGGGGNVTANKMLSGITATGDIGPVVGAIPSKAAQTYTPSTVNQTIAAGQYLSGIQTIAGDADLISANIKAGANIFGVDGSVNITSLGGALISKGSSLNNTVVLGWQPSLVIVYGTSHHYCTDKGGASINYMRMEGVVSYSVTQEAHYSAYNCKRTSDIVINTTGFVYSGGHYYDDSSGYSIITYNYIAIKY